MENKCEVRKTQAIGVFQPTAIEENINDKGIDTYNSPLQFDEMADSVKAFSARVVKCVKGKAGKKVRVYLDELWLALITCFAYTQDTHSEYTMTRVAADHARQSIDILRQCGIEETLVLDTLQHVLLWNLHRLEKEVEQPLTHC